LQLLFFVKDLFKQSIPLWHDVLGRKTLRDYECGLSHLLAQRWVLDEAADTIGKSLDVTYLRNQDAIDAVLDDVAGASGTVK